MPVWAGKLVGVSGRKVYQNLVDCFTLVASWGAEKRRG